MSWVEFMDTKHFGSGVYRPYADWVGDFAHQVDNVLGTDPEFARYVRPIVNRDILFILGKTVAVLCISRSCHRHYPLRHTLKWQEFFSLSEDAFGKSYPMAKTETLALSDAQLRKHLIEDFAFSDPFVIVFPAIFIAKKDTDEPKKRAAAIDGAARMFLENERRFYMEHLESQKRRDIFLSHKTADKTLVAEIADTLRAVGFSPWLDEEKMKAGARLERSISAGFEDSCAAVFFITPNFIDEGFLATEIDYALREKRRKGERFAIITLLVESEEGLGEVPEMLRPFVWKRVKEAQIIRTIVEALPIKLERVVWRE